MSTPLGYELDSSIRSTVRFIQASVLDPHLLEGSLPFDVIFCRNLLIYLGIPARVCVLAIIERLLKVDGLLFIGHADRLDMAGMEPKFIADGDPACFVYRPRTRGDALLSRQPLDEFCALSESVEGRDESSGLEVSKRIAIAPPDPAGQIDTANRAKVLDERTAQASLLDQAAVLANQGHFDDAVAACERHLRTKGVSSPAYFLLGMICQAAGNRQRAEDAFHKTLYLDPEHDEALLALALLAERRGDVHAASGFRRRAERSAISSKRVN